MEFALGRPVLRHGVQRGPSTADEATDHRRKRHFEPVEAHQNLNFPGRRPPLASQEVIARSYPAEKSLEPSGEMANVSIASVWASGMELSFCPEAASQEVIALSYVASRDQL